MYINCVAVWSHSHIITSLIMDSRLLDSEVVEYVRRTLGITDEVRASSVIEILTQEKRQANRGREMGLLPNAKEDEMEEFGKKYQLVFEKRDNGYDYTFKLPPKWTIKTCVRDQRKTHYLNDAHQIVINTFVKYIGYGANWTYFEKDFHCEDCFGPKDWSDIV